MDSINIFYEDPYRKEVKTTITDVFSTGGKNYVEVAENIFHSHGGGQKGDRGTLTIDGQTFTVIDTVKNPNNIYTHLDSNALVIETEVPNSFVGKEVVCKLDWNFRYRQMRLHSAVHLHHCMLEKVSGRSLPPPKTSDIQDGFAFNRYEDKQISQDLVDKANAAFLDVVAHGAEIYTYPDPSGRKGFRWWKCGGYEIPCGGTHPSNVSEIGEVEFSYATKKGAPTINIRLK